MADDQDDSQKTEEPTQKRLDDSLKKGQVAFSRELSSFLLIFTFTLLIGMLAPSIMEDITSMLTKYIEIPDTIEVSKSNLTNIISDLFMNTVTIVALPFLCLVVIALFSGVIQNGIIFTFEPIMPKLEKISLLKGMKRLFSLKSIVELLKGMFKIIVVTAVISSVIIPLFPELNGVTDKSIHVILILLWNMVLKVLIGVTIFTSIIAIIDFLYQKFDHKKNLRMSKKDLKDEYKQTDGNPEVKAKLRAIRAERARSRMMQAVPHADVVITNPTHFSVALQYDTATMKAPVLVAKGSDDIALRIREVAKEHNVPIVENPPVARALFASVEIDEPVPEEHFKAVAEIIAYVFGLKGKSL